MKLKTAVAIALLVFVGSVTTIMVLSQVNRSDVPAASSEERSDSNTEKQTKVFSAEEVASHGTAADCWIIIDSSVYDVTRFISSHPGGAQRITSQCGKDATTAFTTQDGRGSHSAMAKSQLESLKIGTVGSEG